MHATAQKQAFSVAYARAVAARAAFGYSTPEIDLDCVDATITGHIDARTPRGPRLDLQLKCTSRDLLRDDGVHFSLEVAHYDQLRSTERMVPIILVVVVVPDELSSWTDHTEDRLELRRSGYWMSLRGLPAVTTDARTVVLPRVQVFSPAQLEDIMVRVDNGQFP